MDNSETQVWFLGVEDENKHIQLVGLEDFGADDCIGHFIPFFSSYERALSASQALGLNNEDMEDIYPSIYTAIVKDMKRCDDL